MTIKTSRIIVLICGIALPVFSASPDLPVFEKLVQPVLQAKCVGCHGEERPKGKLRMDSYDALITGGSEGASLVPGSVEDSLMMYRVLLPIDDEYEEHMPPPDKDQLTEGELELLKLWVAKGGTPDLKLADLGASESLDATVTEILASAGAAPAKEMVTEVDKEAAEEKRKIAEKVMAEVNATGASLMPVAQDTPQLRFTALNVADQFGDSGLKALTPVADQILWLDLARTQVSDAGLAEVGKMTGLTKLHLEGTSVTDAGLKHLGGLESLEYLNLYKTGVSDAGLQHLASLKNLKRIYLWQSKATPAGAEMLQGKIPGLVVNLGWEYEAQKQAVQVVSAAPAAVEKPAPAVPEVKKPVTPAPAPAKPEVAKPAPAAPAVPEMKKPVTSAPAPAPAKPEVAEPAPAVKMPAEKKAAPAPVTKQPEVKKPESTAGTAAAKTAALVARLEEAHREALLLVEESRKSVAATNRKLNEVEMLAARAREAVPKASGELEKARAEVASLDEVVIAIREALESVTAHPALGELKKSLEEDLIEARGLHGKAKEAVVAAETAAKSGPAELKKLEAAVMAARQSAEMAKAEGSARLAVEGAIAQALELARP